MILYIIITVYLCLSCFIAGKVWEEGRCWKYTLLWFTVGVISYAAACFVALYWYIEAYLQLRVWWNYIFDKGWFKRTWPTDEHIRLLSIAARDRRIEQACKWTLRRWIFEHAYKTVIKQLKYYE